MRRKRCQLDGASTDWIVGYVASDYGYYNGYNNGYNNGYYRHYGYGW
jgi:hypothetical protein